MCEQLRDACVFLVLGIRESVHFHNLNIRCVFDDRGYLTFKSLFSTRTVSPTIRDQTGKRDAFKIQRGYHDDTWKRIWVFLMDIFARKLEEGGEMGYQPFSFRQVMLVSANKSFLENSQGHLEGELESSVFTKKLLKCPIISVHFILKLQN